MDTSGIDRALEELDAAKHRWATLPLPTKVYLLDEIRSRVGDVAEPWVRAAVAAKRIQPGSHLEGEEWTSGPFALATGAAAFAETLRRIERGTPVLAGYPVRTLPNGRAAVRVWPAKLEDRFFLSGHTAEVWMQPGVDADEIEAHAAALYRSADRHAAVSLVLGAGNIASIAPLDVLTELYLYGAVVAVKLNPVNDYLAPYLERVLAPLIEAGFVRFIAGGADEGAYLSRHPLVERIHLTGSAATHDAVVFGTGADATRRKRDDDPVVPVPVTAELGGVGPTIVVGGAWSAADLRYQAEHIISQKLHNHGFNCIACQVLVLPAAWEQGDALLDAMRDVVRELHERDAYYPGAVDRHQLAVSAHPNAEILTSGKAPVTFITDLDPKAASDVCFTTEFFGAVLAVTKLPGDAVPDYLEGAARFANETLHGNLGANLIVDPATARANADALEETIEALRFGTVAVNSWVGVAFAMSRATWGAFPGNTRNDIQSGTGVRHNALMLENTERTVVRGPFAPFPRTLRHREFHTEPIPPFYVTNTQAATLGALLTERAVTGSAAVLPRIAAAAFRG